MYVIIRELNVLISRTPRISSFSSALPVVSQLWFLFSEINSLSLVINILKYLAILPISSSELLISLASKLTSPSAISLKVFVTTFTGLTIILIDKLAIIIAVIVAKAPPVSIITLVSFSILMRSAFLFSSSLSSSLLISPSIERNSSIMFFP